MSSDINVQPEELRRPLGVGDGDDDGPGTGTDGHYEGNGGPTGTPATTGTEDGQPEGNKPPRP